MKGFINACGVRDSLGQSRLDEVRGLLRFSGKTVVSYILDEFEEIGITEPVLMYVNPSHRASYNDFFYNNDYNVDIRNYYGDMNPLLVYFSGLNELKDDDVLMVADDNLFNFSLNGLIEKFQEVGDNVLATRKLEMIAGDEHKNLNFGMCEYDDSMKIISASYSFNPSIKIDTQNVVLDIYAIHKKRMRYFEGLANSGKNRIQKASKMWWKDFYAWESVSGFWADVGKLELRKQAESYFNYGR